MCTFKVFSILAALVTFQCLMCGVKNLFIFHVITLLRFEKDENEPGTICFWQWYMCSWLFHLIRIKMYNCVVVIWLDFSTGQNERAVRVWKPRKVRGKVALICLSVHLTLPVQYETCEQSSGNWNSCSLPLVSCFRTRILPPRVLALCCFHSVTS